MEEERRRTTFETARSRAVLSLALFLYYLRCALFVPRIHPYRPRYRTNNMNLFLYTHMCNGSGEAGNIHTRRAVIIIGSKY